MRLSLHDLEPGLSPSSYCYDGFSAGDLPADSRSPVSVRTQHLNSNPYQDFGDLGSSS